MKPKERAKDLFDKLYTPIYEWTGNGYEEDIETSTKNTKRNVLITIQEIIDTTTGRYGSQLAMQYWLDVEKEMINFKNNEL